LNETGVNAIAKLYAVLAFDTVKITPLVVYHPNKSSNSLNPYLPLLSVTLKLICVDVFDHDGTV